MSSPTPPAYNPNIPVNAFDSLAESQPEIQDNFQSLLEVFMMNHVPIDAVSGAGTHTIVELLERSADQETNLDEIAVYVKDVEGQTDQIFLRYPNGTTIQLTNYQLYSLNQTANPNGYFTFLPGKILVYFGLTASPTINLFPQVAKNIFSTSLCSGANAPITPKAFVAFTKTDEGFYKSAILSYGNVTFPKTYYLFLANL